MAEKRPPRDEMIAGLIQRIYRLEGEVAELRRLQGLPEHRPEPAAAKGAPARAPVPAPASPQAVPQTRPTARTRLEDEANVIGTWFARVGVVAILFGAAFAFKYAVDRGFIGPTARVGVGFLAGLGFVVWAETMRRRGWHLIAQAVSGGGIALWYLSILAALHLYDLVSPAVAFVCLLAVTGIAALLATRTNSLALAMLALVGGFLAPFLVGIRELDPYAFLSYVAALDLLVLLVAPRRWPALDRVALIGSAVVVIAITPEMTFGQRVGFATTLFAIFAFAFTVRTVRRADSTPTTPADVIVGIAASYYGYVLFVLSDAHEGWSGLFTASLAALVGAGAYVMLRRSQHREAMAMVVVASALAVLFVPIQLSAEQIAAAWAAEGILLLMLTMRTGVDVRLRGGAYVLWLIASVSQLAVLADRYPTPRLVTTWTAFFAIGTIVALGFASWLVTRAESDGHDDLPAPAWAIAANVVALAWMSTELGAEVSRHVSDPEQPVQFALTALWTVYAAVLFACGVLARARWARLSGAVLFAVTIGKIAISDLWMLPTSYRIVAFLGLGGILLACSLLYQRFRDLLLENEVRSA